MKIRWLNSKLFELKVLPFHSGKILHPKQVLKAIEG
mgnify:CR=1 FL=1